MSLGAAGWWGHRQVNSEQEVRGSGTKIVITSVRPPRDGTGGQIHEPETGSATHSLCDWKQVQESLP